MGCPPLDRRSARSEEIVLFARILGNSEVIHFKGKPMKRVLRWTSAIALACASTLAFGGNNLPNNGFWVGYDEPWIGDTYGNWLARNVIFASPAQFNPGLIDAYFAEMAYGKAKIVRIWLFPGLQGIDSPTAPQALHSRGLTPDFLQNLVTVLNLARNHGLRVYMTALNGGDMRTVAKSDAQQPVRAYFKKIVSNKNGERDAFKNNILAPLLDRLNRYNLNHPGVIYALDLINEIEAALSVGVTYFPTNWLGARDLIRDLASFTKARSPWLPLTASAGFSLGVQDLTGGLFSGLGLDFYDLHVYSDTGRYAGQAALCDRVRLEGKQIILGEFGQKTKLYSDALQDYSTRTFLYGARNSCFSAALAWKYEAQASENWLTYRTNAGTFRPAFFAIQRCGASPSSCGL